MENCKKVVRLILPAVRLAVTRKASSKGMVQTKIAKYLGIAQAEVSKYLQGKVSEKIKELADKLAEDEEIDKIVDAIENGKSEDAVSQEIDDVCAKVSKTV